MMDIISPDRVRFGPYEADLHTHELWKHGLKIKLVGQPFEILAVLISRPGQLVTREELRTQLWPGDTFVDFNHGLNAAVNKLRDALCDSAEDPRYIETLPRRGYRFVAAVERAAPEPGAETLVASPSSPPEPRVKGVAAGPEPALHGEAGPATVIPSLKAIAKQPNKRRWWLRRAVQAAALIGGLWLLVNFGILDVLRSHSERQEKRAAEAQGTRSFTPLTSLSDPTSEPAFSPDGNLVAFRRDSFLPGMSGIFVKRVGGEELIQLTSDKGDCCPVWSPDGKSVAFSRFSDQERAIYEVPSKGGEPRRVFSSSNPGSQHGELDWSPDGGSVAFVGRNPEGRSSLFLLSLEISAARAVTMPSASEADWGPVFSPDGQRLAFVRSSANGSQENIFVMPAGGGEVQRLTAQPSRLMGSPTWSSDGQSIIFGATLEQSTGLFRVPATGGAPVPIREAGSAAWHPTASRRGFRLAFQQISGGRSISQLDLSPPGQKPRGLVTTVSGENAGAQFSPDGKKLVFFSDRSGGLDLWLSDRDGQNPVQLTSIGTAGTPRWSPDGKLIVFDVGLGQEWQQPRAIFTVNTYGGTPRSLVQDSYNNPAPCWSLDGQWVYFPSDRSGDWQVWKVSSEGGVPVQITKQGGFAAWEGPDHNLYYAKHRYPEPELWRIPVGGGSEAPVYPPVRPVDWAAWTVVEKGILFVELGPNNVPTLSFFDFAALRVSHLAVLDRAPFWLGATADGKSVAFDQPENQESHIMLLENFK